MNKAIIAGRLGQDPELRFTQGSTAVLNMRIATTERFQDREGENKERTEWHSVVMWGKRGESLSKILNKGDFVVVEGRLQTRSWEDKQGQKRYTTEIVATDLTLTGGKRRADSDGDVPPKAPPQHDEDDSDIPF